MRFTSPGLALHRRKQKLSLLWQVAVVACLEDLRVCGGVLSPHVCSSTTWEKESQCSTPRRDPPTHLPTAIAGWLMGGFSTLSVFVQADACKVLVETRPG